jgi:energy-coupling factor transporter ATP-binding protein EcfA2
VARIIALLGEKGSGKSTVAKMISEALPERSVYQPALADPIKRGAQAMLTIPMEHLWGASELREKEISGLPGVTVRHVLQTLGTEWGRDCIDPNLWIKLLVQYAATLGPEDIVVISDCRFLNEARVLSEAGASIWRIRRSERSIWREICNKFPFLYTIGDWLKLSPHRSEREMWYSEMDYYVNDEIPNVGSLIDLRAIVLLNLLSKHGTTPAR